MNFTSPDVKKEQRGVMATQTAAAAVGAKTFTAEEKNACSIDAMPMAGRARPANNIRTLLT